LEGVKVDIFIHKKKSEEVLQLEKYQMHTIRPILRHKKEMMLERVKDMKQLNG